MEDAIQPLRELFDRIDALELAAMRDRREEETFNLDFKRMEPSGDPSPDDRKNLRVSISGFANSSGGILLWGVDSKAPEDRRDRSRFQAIVPIKDGDRAVARLHELTATATQPPVSGVVHRTIPVDGGFVVKTFVPASDGGPHRTNEEKGQYFRRDADAFRAMQHHEIADMFGRRARPRLELWWQQVFGDAQLHPEVQCAWVIGLKNTGRGIARFPALTLTVLPGYGSMGVYGLNARGVFGLPSRPVATSQVRTHLFAGGGDDVVHPGQVLHVTRIGLEKGGDMFCRFGFEIFAERMPVVEGFVRVWLNGLKLETPAERGESW